MVGHEFFILFGVDVVQAARAGMRAGVAKTLVSDMVAAADGNADAGVAVAVDGIDVHAAQNGVV